VEEIAEEATGAKSALCQFWTSALQGLFMQKLRLSSFTILPFFNNQHPISHSNLMSW